MRTLMNFRPLLAAAVCASSFALQGCVATLPQHAPPASGPSAQLRLDTTVTVASRHAFVSGTGQCAARALTASPGDVRIPAERPVLVQQGFFSVWPMSTRHCNIALVFKPDAAGRYLAAYRMNGETRVCQMDLWKIHTDGSRTLETSARPVHPCAEP